VEIAGLLMQRGCRIALLGGPDEAETNRLLAEQLGPDILQTGSDNTELEFTAIVGRCDVVVAGDTLAMHCAISQKVPVVALFGPTCEQEIDLFERGRKIVTTHPCSPCYRRSCDENPSCMDVLDSRQIARAVEEWLPAGGKPSMGET
jgi:heptosyltransferase-2